MLELVYGRGDPGHSVPQKDIEFFVLEPQENYVGIEDIKPLEIDGKRVYLDQNELNKSTVFVANGVHVCYANNKTIDLYEDAMKDVPAREDAMESVGRPHGQRRWIPYEDAMEDISKLKTSSKREQRSRKGVLVLDCCCPRVHVQQNIQVSSVEESHSYQK